MHYGIEVVPFGPYSDPRLVVERAPAASAAGWEAITLWDHVLFPDGTGRWDNVTVTISRIEHCQIKRISTVCR